jgi:siroheme synthase
MALRRLEATAQALLSAGMNPATPAAAVESGTLPGQRVVVTTLGELVNRVRTEGISSPAMIVVGGIVGMREKLAR